MFVSLFQFLVRFMFLFGDLVFPISCRAGLVLDLNKSLFSPPPLYSPLLPPPPRVTSPLHSSGNHEWLSARPNLGAPEHGKSSPQGHTLRHSCHAFGWEGVLIVTLVGLLLCCDSNCSTVAPSACTSQKVNPPLGGRMPACEVTKQRGAPVVHIRFIYVRTFSTYDDSGTKPGPLMAYLC